MKRDPELIERARNMSRVHKWPTAEEVAGFALAEIRRAVREELEALRVWWLTRIAVANYDPMVHEIDRRLAALGGTKHSGVAHLESAESPEQAASKLGARNPAQDSEVARSTRAPATTLTDSDVLERAAEIVTRECPAGGRHWMIKRAAELRASAAALTQDWAEKLSEAYGNTPDGVDLAAFLRERLGPVVERVQSRAQAGFTEDVAALRNLEGK